MYFFIALVIVTFLTLYAYFTIVQKSEAQARARINRKKQGLMDDESSPMDNTSFADFLSGQYSSDEIIHPRAAPMVLNPAMKSALNTAGQAVAIGMGMGTAAFFNSKKSSDKTPAADNTAEMKDTAFGPAGLKTIG